MKNYLADSLSYDPLHGYIPFTSRPATTLIEVVERDILDHAWVQRLRQIHQLQTAWYVFPTAEHARFQHVLGVMHLASRAAAALYDSLQESSADVPSRGYVETLLRMAGLLHDVGHGPFGHFFDEHYLSKFGLTHETVGSVIIQRELGDLLRGLRRNPNSVLESHETLDPAQIAFLIARPKSGDTDQFPNWLTKLRALFSGIYTVDNLDFILRDAYMSGYNSRAVDVDRLLRYSFFTTAGLTIHPRGMDALIRFIGVRGELFRTIYFHRTVRAIDLTLKDLFVASQEYLFPGNPLEYLAEYQHFTEWSLLIDVARWHTSDDPRKRELGVRWSDFLRRKITWKMICQRNLVFGMGESEHASIFSRPSLVEAALRDALPADLQQLPLRVDLARHVHRPDTRGPAAGQNFLWDLALNSARPLTDDQLFRHLPLSHRICRIYAESELHSATITLALDQLLGPGGQDDLTNM